MTPMNDGCLAAIVVLFFTRSYFANVKSNVNGNILTIKLSNAFCPKKECYGYFVSLYILFIWCSLQKSSHPWSDGNFTITIK